MDEPILTDHRFRNSAEATGPLVGVRILELGGIGPGPFACMALADLGADVVRIERPEALLDPAAVESARFAVLNRGRRSIGIDLKSDAGRDVALRFMTEMDAVVEGWRPGVAEELGLGPEEALARNPRLVYGRMTGWGQSGPLSSCAGHDIAYTAVSGALHVVGRVGERPAVPPGIVGDNGGGGMLLALGIVSAILEARISGSGQVVDAAIVDGSALLTAALWGMREQGSWSDEHGVNLADSGAPFYDVYECADGRYVAVGSIEPQFYAQLLLGLDVHGIPSNEQYDVTKWPLVHKRLQEVFIQRDRDAWCEILRDFDACFAPVLNLDEAPGYAHNVERRTFVEIDGVRQPAPAPRFSRTPGAIRRPPPLPGQHTEEILDEMGFTGSDIELMRKSGAIA
jgi:alpha-methylacyl-CoA racemase